MAFTEIFFIPKPAAAGATQVKFDSQTKSLPAYQDHIGRKLIWADHNGSTPLPEIGETVMITMNGIGPAVVKGYFASGETEGQMFLGVMTLALHPPKWLKQQNRDDAKDASKPEWIRQGIGCEFACEIRPYQVGDTMRHKKELAALRAKNKGTMWEGRY